MKKLLVFVLWTWAIVGGYTQAALNVANPLDRIVAVVNDDVITELELNREVENIKKQFQQQNTALPPDAVLRKQLLERVILRHIQLQLAKRMHIQVNDETLNRTLDNMAAQNGLSLAQFREVLRKEGIAYAQFRENMRDEITINQLQQRQVHSRITITEQEIDSYLQNEAVRNTGNVEYHLAHILIAVPEAASPEEIAQAKQKADDIVASLRGGVDFTQTAIAKSDGQQALEGGDLGWRRAESLPSLFADWAITHQTNDISDAMRSASGFHIIKILETRTNETQFLVKQTHARHILLRTDEFKSSDEVRQQLLKIRERIVAGEDFAQLAKEFSEDPGSAVEGGDLGWVNPKDMVPEFEQAMNTLAINTLSEPVRTQFGWHLIEVLGHREHDNTEQVRRNKAREVIQARKLEPAMQSWLRRLRAEAFVETRL